jgi:hypothetical protein
MAGCTRIVGQVTAVPRPDAARRLRDRAGDRPHEGALALAIGPGVEVIGDERELEARLLGRAAKRTRSRVRTPRSRACSRSRSSSRLPPVRKLTRWSRTSGCLGESQDACPARSPSVHGARGRIDAAVYKLRADALVTAATRAERGAWHAVGVGHDGPRPHCRSVASAPDSRLRNQPRASAATRSSAPGSSKRCVAPGTTTSSVSV